ncbi:HNH endonuclease signature motif containing protein [Microbacterium sp.]|uniref:HNH endonuclease signature motif containing protein n=1 Tax=Microbacterium sp. TaxID=51671 RepID=UPI003F9D5FE7
MATFTDVAALIPTLCGQLAEGESVAGAQASMMQMPDAEVVRVLAETAALARQVEQIQLAAAGVIALRSKRERGHSGLSASRGHRSAAALIQDLTGSTKAEANRVARVGESLVDGGAGSSSSDGQLLTESVEADTPPPPEPWFQPLRNALRDARVTAAEFDAIQRGLGEPPEIDTKLVHGAELENGAELTDADALAAARENARAAWAQAAEQLIDASRECTAEELWHQARSIRDLLDPEGAEARFAARFEKRSFRTYRDQDGQKRANMVLDDEGDLFIETILAAAMRPRRGGPRFVDSDEQERAKSLIDDPRTNDQLAYDLILDVMRAGTLADAKSVFGTRQAGVRLVQVVDADGTAAPVAHSEDHVMSMPAAVAEQHICDTGVVPVTIDECGNPLDVGREQRLFTPRQRIGLAIRDGGCRWQGCDRPASYCEAHHIDEWKKDQGHTDIDRGVPL